MSAPTHVVVLGAMGVGKTTTGTALAAELYWRYVDSDVDLARLAGCSGADFAAAHGVPALHELEAAVLLGALSSAEPSVITAAASIVENRLVRELLPRRAVVVRLVLSPSATLERQEQGTHRRPMSKEELVRLAERREPFFSMLEDVRLDAGLGTDELVTAIVEHLRT
jgi:shikimate kinase